MLVKALVGGRDERGIPRPIGNGSHIGNKLHHEGWGDRGHLHGHHDHLGGESDPQQPWTGGSTPGAYNTGHNGPCLRSDQ